MLYDVPVDGLYCEVTFFSRLDFLMGIVGSAGSARGGEGSGRLTLGLARLTVVHSSDFASQSYTSTF